MDAKNMNHLRSGSDPSTSCEGKQRLLSSFLSSLAFPFLASAESESVVTCRSRVTAREVKERSEKVIKKCWWRLSVSSKKCVNSASSTGGSLYLSACVACMSE